MRILALEFSSVQRSVAVLHAGERQKILAASEVLETGGQRNRALSMVEEALREAHLGRGQIDRLAVGLGPGSYTGIRAAIALAQGWQLARDIKLLGVSSADCVAAQAQTESLNGPVSVVIDAQRGEFYLASYELSATAWQELYPIRLAGRADVQAAQASGHMLVGPEVTKWFPSGRLIVPQAAMLARLALVRSDFLPGERLEPIYLRQTTFVKAPPTRVLPP